MKSSLRALVGLVLRLGGAFRPLRRPLLVRRGGLLLTRLVRIVIEHGLALRIAEKTKDFGGPRIPTIDVVPNAFERRVFAPFLFNYHCAHHLFMGVPHYQLPKLHRILRDNQFEGHHKIEGGYIRALFRAMKEEKLG